MVRRVLGAAVLSVSLACSAALAQEEAAKKEEPAAAESRFSELRARTDELNEQARKLIDEARTANEERKTAIRREFQALVAEQQKVVQQLQGAALAEYQAAPQQNAEAAQVLAELAAEHLRRDRYEEARELVEPLIKNQSDVDGIYATAGAAAFSMNDFEAAKTYFSQAEKQGALRGDAAQYAGEVDAEQAKWRREQELREKEAQADDLPRVRLTTTKGELTIELFENEAPNTVANFISLVEKGFYDGLPFHRVIGGFMAQGGDPAGDGTGGPGYAIECECDEEDARMHFRGSLSMAHSGPDTGGSQFFLTFRPTPHLDKLHTVFGRVIEGLDVLPKLTRRQPSLSGRTLAPDKIVKAEVIRKRDHAYQPKTIAEKP